MLASPLTDQHHAPPSGGTDHTPGRYRPLPFRVKKARPAVIGRARASPPSCPYRRPQLPVRDASRGSAPAKAAVNAHVLVSDQQQEALHGTWRRRSSAGVGFAILQRSDTPVVRLPSLTASSVALLADPQFDEPAYVERHVTISTPALKAPHRHRRPRRPSITLTLATTNSRTHRWPPRPRDLDRPACRTKTPS